MSQGAKVGWKLEFRQDEIETLLSALGFVIECSDTALNSKTREDRLAHQVCRQRVTEIRDYITATCG